jgi:hypothetical protein
VSATASLANLVEEELVGRLQLSSESFIHDAQVFSFKIWCVSRFRLLYRSNRYVTPSWRNIAGQFRRGMFFNWPWVDDSHGALNDLSPSPRACPFLEDGIALHTILQAGDKALLGCVFICCQQKCKRYKLRVCS